MAGRSAGVDGRASPGAGRGAGGTFRVASGILLSRLSGLARERAIAHFFGASLYADAWRAALRLPNVLQNLLGEGTLSASFIPVYSELVEQGREEDARRFAGAALGLLAVVAGLMAFLGVLLAPVLVAVFFAGFDPERQALTVELIRILFPMTAVLVLSAWALGVLNSHRRFFLSYAAPVAWNLSMIGVLVAAGVYLAFPSADLVVALAWGALAGGALQLGVKLPSTLRLLGEFRPSLRLDAPGVREAIRNFVPVLTARGVVNLSGWLDYALAAFLVTGAVAALGYAQTLYLLPISLFGMAVAASELPELAREREADRAVMARNVSSALDRVALFLVPSTLVYLFLGDVVAAALFQTGEFGRDETVLVHAVLAAYALGMPASASSRVLSSAYYALRDTRTPARIAYLRVAVSLALGASLMLPLDGFGVGEFRFGAVGLALGASAGAWLEYLLLRRRLGPRIGAHGPDRPRMVRVAVAAGGAVAVGLAVLWALPELHPVLVAAGTLLPVGVIFVALGRVLGVRFPLSALRSVGRRDGGPGDPTDSFE